MNARLVGVGPNSSDARLSQLPITIGRSPDVGAHLDDLSVSHYHCRIVEIDGQLIVHDLGSRHGTFVNGTRITRSVLMPGDILDIGRRRFVAQYTPSDQCRTAAQPYKTSSAIFTSLATILGDLFSMISRKRAFAYAR